MAFPVFSSSAAAGPIKIRLTTEHITHNATLSGLVFIIHPPK
jgi:hypothetical protein